MTKKIIAIVMAVMFVVAMATVSASAEVTTSGGSDNTRVVLTYGSDTDNDGVLDKGANFRVTVPTELPFTVDSDNNVTVADNAKITNLSNGQVDVTAVSAATTGGWAIVANGTDFTKVPVDSKQFTFTLNGDNFGAGTSVDLTLGSAWTTIDGNDELALPYSGTFAIQSAAHTAEQIATVTFTVAWHTAD